MSNLEESVRHVVDFLRNPNKISAKIAKLFVTTQKLTITNNNSQDVSYNLKLPKHKPVHKTEYVTKYRTSTRSYNGITYYYTVPYSEAVYKTNYEMDGVIDINYSQNLCTLIGNNEGKEIIIYISNILSYDYKDIFKSYIGKEIIMYKFWRTWIGFYDDKGKFIRLKMNYIDLGGSIFLDTICIASVLIMAISYYGLVTEKKKYFLLGRIFDLI